MPILARSLMLLFAILHTLDVITTHLFLSIGGIEANPVIAALHAQYGTTSVVAFKVIGLSFLFWFLQYRFSVSEQVVVLRIASIVYVLLLVHNLVYYYFLLGLLW